MARAHTTTATLAATLTLLAALTGCGSSNTTTSASNDTPTTSSNQNTPAPTPPPPTNPTTTTTPTSKTASTHAPPEPAPTVEKVELTSPAFHPEGPIPVRYTCDGKNTSPPLRWKGIPPHTAELMLHLLNFKPVNGKLYFDWALTGISPTSHEAAPGTTQPGATTGTNSAGQTTYHLCPTSKTQETYVAVLFALPHHLPAKQGFNPQTLRLQALHTAKYESLLLFNYKKH